MAGGTGKFRWARHCAGTGSAALPGIGVGHCAHCGLDGAESPYCPELLDEPAPEAGREVKPRGGDGRHAPGRVDVRRRSALIRRVLKTRLGVVILFKYMLPHCTRPCIGRFNNVTIGSLGGRLKRCIAYLGGTVT